MEDQVKCPRCGSTQISADKKGFSGTKAVAGAALTGGIGLLAGTIGSNRIKITCLNCGHIFYPGERPNHQKTEPIPFKTGVFKIVLPVILFLILFLVILHFAGFLAALAFMIVFLIILKLILK